MQNAPEMKEQYARQQIVSKRKEMRPWVLTVAVIAAGASIYADFYLRPSDKGVAQVSIWSFCALSLLVIGVRRVLRRKQLLLPFLLTVILQCILVYATRSLFPVRNSLILILVWVPGMVVLFVTFACLARVLDPFGPRPE